MASAKFCVRALGKSESVGSIMLSMAGVSVVGSTLLAAIVPGQALLVPPSGAVWALLAGTGLLACCVQTLATCALKMCKATPVTLVGYLSGALGVGQALLASRESRSAWSVKFQLLVVLRDSTLPVATCLLSSSGSQPFMRPGPGYVVLPSNAHPCLDMFAVVWGTLGDLLVYNRKPSALGLAGAALVCSSSLIIIFSEKWQAGAATAPAGSGGGGGEELDSESGRLLPNQAADTKAQSSTTGEHLDAQHTATDWTSGQHPPHLRRIELAASRRSADACRPVAGGVGHLEGTRLTQQKGPLV